MSCPRLFSMEKSIWHVAYRPVVPRPTSVGNKFFITCLPGLRHRMQFFFNHYSLPGGYVRHGVLHGPNTDTLSLWSLVGMKQAKTTPIIRS